METLYRARAWFASAPSFFLFATLIILTVTGLPKPVKPPSRPPIRITIAPPPATPPTPLPTVPEVAQVQQQTVDIPMPTPVMKQVQRPTPRPTPNPAPNVAPQPETPVAPSAPAVSATPAPPHPAAPNANINDAYVAQIRSYLESVKHYPTGKEARMQRPRGEVQVWFVLDRGGSVKDTGIENSSGSLILDGAALSTVRGASYPPFPAEVYPNEPTHRFTVSLNYQLT